MLTLTHSSTCPPGTPASKYQRYMFAFWESMCRRSYPTWTGWTGWRNLSLSLSDWEDKTGWLAQELPESIRCADNPVPTSNRPVLVVWQQDPVMFRFESKS